VTETSTHDAGQTYRIGAVARLTGIPPDTLRVWERRYAVVTPIRSEAGTRLYRAEDVSRLTLIKRLVDNGDAISHVAALSLDQLQDRVQGLSTATPMREPRPCRVVVLGVTLPALLELELERAGDRQEEPRHGGVRFVGLFREESRFRAEAAGLGPDLVVIEAPTLHADQLRDVTDLIAAAGATRAIVVYSFAPRAVVERLKAQQIMPQRAPVEADDLRRWCLAVHNAAPAPEQAMDLLSDLSISGPVPPRRYDNATLMQIAARSSTVRCECPRHLVALVTSLVAFENYSRECENRNPDDAALHAFLLAATARARATLESALARVIEAEGIEL